MRCAQLKWSCGSLPEPCSSSVRWHLCLCTQEAQEQQPVVWLLQATGCCCYSCTGSSPCAGTIT